MKNLKKIISIVFSYLSEVLIYFSFSWAIILALTFSCVLPKEGLTVLGFVIVVVSIERIQKWIKSRNKVNQQ